ncbi:phosphohistidine phosphatase SixA [Endozoicomonas sp.]|uniref:phosphohistidine phosphatase SixA n=1 Tax=Endozoicomonas sp. TaxID=1892382 RepID=UPI002886F0AA|nr:phosphohistidine phosphatase SixA [Endozoicomonas sp.]
MKLIIMRHGEASWSAPSDMERVLTDQGVREVSSTVASLATQKVDRIFASPYLRAQQTARIAAGALGCEVETLPGLEPDGNPQALLPMLPEAGVILLASHMPMVGCLSGLLCDGTPRSGPSFQTGMALILEMDILAPGMAQVLERIMP